jgi:hypothetical protein
LKVCPQLYEAISLENDIRAILKDLPSDAPGFIDKLYKEIAEDRSDRETIKFIHFSDAHLDLNYKVGATADCGLHYCCREESETGQGNVKAGYWGANPNRNNTCDIPMHTFQNALSLVNSFA